MIIARSSSFTSLKSDPFFKFRILNEDDEPRIFLWGKMNGFWEAMELTGCDLCISQTLPHVEPTDNAWIITPLRLHQLNENRNDYDLVLTAVEIVILAYRALLL